MAMDQKPNRTPNIPIPTKIGSKMGGAFPNPNQNGAPQHGFDQTHRHMSFGSWTTGATWLGARKRRQVRLDAMALPGGLGREGWLVGRQKFSPRVFFGQEFCFIGNHLKRKEVPGLCWPDIFSSTSTVIGGFMTHHLNLRSSKGPLNIHGLLSPFEGKRIFLGGQTRFVKGRRLEETSRLLFGGGSL